MPSFDIDLAILRSVIFFCELRLLLLLKLGSILELSVVEALWDCRVSVAVALGYLVSSIVVGCHSVFCDGALLLAVYGVLVEIRCLVEGHEHIRHGCAVVYVIC